MFICIQEPIVWDLTCNNEHKILVGWIKAAVGYKHEGTFNICLSIISLLFYLFLKVLTVACTLKWNTC